MNSKERPIAGQLLSPEIMGLSPNPIHPNPIFTFWGIYLPNNTKSPNSNLYNGKYVAEKETSNPTLPIICMSVFSPIFCIFFQNNLETFLNLCFLPFLYFWKICSKRTRYSISFLPSKTEFNLTHMCWAWITLWSLLYCFLKGYVAFIISVTYLCFIFPARWVF